LHILKTARPHFLLCYLWTRLGLPLAAMRYVMYRTSGFVDDVMFLYMEGTGPNQRRCVCLVQFARRWH